MTKEEIAVGIALLVAVAFLLLDVYVWRFAHP